MMQYVDSRVAAHWSTQRASAKTNTQGRTLTLNLVTRKGTSATEARVKRVYGCFGASSYVDLINRDLGIPHSDYWVQLTSNLLSMIWHL